MGFGERWCKWVQTCQKSASVLVLVNGSPKLEFKMERGLKQGDPLSPFLFLVAAEGLNVTLKDAVRTGLYKGVKISTSDIPIFHLQYADDTLIFGEWKESNARNLMKIMECVKQASSLKINSNKTKLYGIGVHNEELEGNYGEVQEKIRKLEDKDDLLSWKIDGDKVGGLNIGNIKAFNWALIGKWWWRFRVEENRLWVRVVKSIYGNHGGLKDEEGVHRMFRGSKWGDIVKTGRDIQNLGFNFCSSFEKKLGNGNNTLFWLDSWIGDGVILSEKFHRLYRLEINKDITVGDKRVWRNDTWDWMWDWARELRGRGLGDFEELMVLINFFFPNVLQEDSWRWIHDDDGAFTVKKLREMVDDKILNRTIGAQETKWCKIVPRKVCIFIWRLQRRRLPVYT
ncbi:RNA-directed DNA polymerase, eukaryota, reverse transcriptase zinc-binding domain protein [Tanacetum coccineum]